LTRVGRVVERTDDACRAQKADVIGLCRGSRTVFRAVLRVFAKRSSPASSAEFRCDER